MFFRNFFRCNYYCHKIVPETDFSNRERTSELGRSILVILKTDIINLKPESLCPYSALLHTEGLDKGYLNEVYTVSENTFLNSAWSKTILIRSCMGRVKQEQVGPPTSKRRMFCLLPLSAPIFNKQSHGHKLRNVSNFKLPNCASLTTLPKFGSFQFPQLVSDEIFLLKINTLIDLEPKA